VSDYAVSYPHAPWVSRDEMQVYRAAIAGFQRRIATERDGAPR
jgi:hypothetical protein